MRRLSITGWIYITLSIFVVLSCGEQQHHAQLRAKLDIVDSMMYAGKKNTAKDLLIEIRGAATPSNPLLSRYYYWKAHLNREQPSVFKNYADSALKLFDDKAAQEKHPQEYLTALLLAGDGAFINHHFALALKLYVKASLLEREANCKTETVSSKIATAYYEQRKYLFAARYILDDYRQRQKCLEGLTADERFFITQGSLDNAGVCYEKANMTDSALYYYQKDIDFIKASSTNKNINRKLIDAASIVVYGNIGGLLMKQGKLQEAEHYFTSVINITPNDGAQHELTYIDLAELYTTTKQYSQALTYLSASRKILDTSRSDGRKELRWLKVNASYHSAMGNRAEAHVAWSRYYELKDSVDKSMTDLYQLDLSEELVNLQNQQQISDLRNKERIQNMFIGGLLIVVLAAIAIMVLIYKNMRMAKNHEQKTFLQNKQLQEALSKLENTNKKYIRVMRVMVHDLKNPLSGITGIAGILKEQPNMTPDSLEMLEMIESTGRNTGDMIANLLRFGLADENMPVETEPNDVNAVIKECVNLLQFEANKKGQQISILENGEGPLMAAFKYDKIWRVMNNLLVNAIKFSYEGSIITVAAQKLDSDFVQISVKDNGIGIPKSKQEEIFELFTPAKRLGTAKEPSFGLGLAICKNIIIRHGGTMWVESKEGEGSTFFFTLKAVSS